MVAEVSTSTPMWPALSRARSITPSKMRRPESVPPTVIAWAPAGTLIHRTPGAGGPLERVSIANVCVPAVTVSTPPSGNIVNSTPTSSPPMGAVAVDAEERGMPL